MDDHKEQIEWLRGFEIDHLPDGWPAIRMREISAMRDAVESLLAENERLKHNIAVTEQTMREYQELAAKRLEEIAKYRDAPVVVWRTRPYDYGIGHKGIYASTHFKEQSEAWKRNGWRVEELIVKPGEEK